VSTSVALARTTTIASTAMIAMIRIQGMMSSASQALPPPEGSNDTPPPETLTPNQSKNMKMKSRIAEMPAICSPCRNLLMSIQVPPWG
jgi:hypothetical protein